MSEIIADDFHDGPNGVFIYCVYILKLMKLPKMSTYYNFAEVIDKQVKPDCLQHNARER